MRASGCMMAEHKCGTGLVCAQHDVTCWTNPRAMDPNFTTIWRGSGLPLLEQGIKILGTPLGHEEFVRNHLMRTIEEHTVLLDPDGP